MKTLVTRKENTWPSIDAEPSLLGFGCMRFPTLHEDKPDIDEKRAEAMLDYAYRNGVNYFDTAYPYHHKLSEPFVGRVLSKYPRESFYLATKMPSWEIESVEDAKRIFNEQLERLQVDYFDFYLCHALSKKNFEPYKLPGVMDFLNKMRDEGKIRHLGFSFHDTPEVLEEIIHANDWDFVQLQLNYLDWDYQNAKKQYAIVAEYGVPVIVMEPVRGGTLADLSEKANDIFKKAQPDKSLASWAIRYAATKDDVMVVLSGMSAMDQVKDNVDTMTDFEPIDGDDQDVIDEALAAYLENKTVPCTSCRYCMPCPEGVDIPHMFKIYNDYQISGYKQGFIHAYEKTEEAKRADNCIACGKCMEHCPQGIEIPDRMEDIRKLYDELVAEST